MPHSITGGQQFPMPCPTCKAVSGMPFIAGTTLESGVIRVGVRCSACGHEWRFDMPVTVESKRDSGIHRL